MTGHAAPAAADNGDAQAPPGALVVGGAHVSIAVARSLGRRGIPVWLLASHPLPRLSRYVQRSFPWPGAEHRDGAASIVDVAVRHGLKGWVLFATGDEDMRLIAQNHALLAPYLHVATANWDTTQWVYDKRLTYRRAASLGIECPRSFQACDLETVRQSQIQFPVVLKPACRDAINEFTRAKAWKADDREALVSLYRRAASLVGADAVIVQEFIPGNGEAQFSYAGLWDRGKPVASLVARRTRQYPVDFGFTSTFVETIEHGEVEAQAFRFLADLRFSGMAELEFKHDARDSRTKLLDVNPRPWTWIGLGAAAGVDFPWIQWRLARGEAVPRLRGRAGCAWTHASRDAVAAVRSMFGDALGAADYARSLLRPLTFAAFAADDPWPAIVDLPISAGRVLTRRLGLGQRGRGRVARNRPAPSV